jgi:hypothetical protein
MPAADTVLAPSTDPSSVAMSFMAQAVAAQVTSLLKLELAKLGGNVGYNTAGETPGTVRDCVFCDA